jgi:hypothetical protein
MKEEVHRWAVSIDEMTFATMSLVLPTRASNAFLGIFKTSILECEENWLGRAEGDLEASGRPRSEALDFQLVRAKSSLRAAGKETDRHLRRAKDFLLNG